MKRLTITTLSLALLVGCASHEPSSSGSATTTAAPEPSASASSPGKTDFTYRLPIAAYSYSQADYEMIESAEQILARDCMKRFRLSYQPAKDSSPAVTSDRRYGLSDMNDAARYGYRLPPQPAVTEPKLTEDEIKVLYGSRNFGSGEKKSEKLKYQGKEVPETGCLGSSIKNFGKPYEYPTGVTAASNIATDSYRASLRDPEVKSVFAQWSACMKQKGYDYASPMDPLGSPAFSKGRVTTKEKKTAMTDMRCKQSTNLLESWLDVESKIQKKMIQKNIKVLQKMSELHKGKVGAARKIVAGA
ncbi:hypothetical protein ACFWA5_13895 [Streptomyces mirabilis]|uniref:hypothetical protein n=1 Tax=Streptomyces mirabilis TaxID=68239 RepID=UPI00364EB249